MPLAEIAAPIRRSADFLASELPDLAERQRSMRAVFTWAWRLLTWYDRALGALRAADMPARKVMQTSVRLAQLAQAVGDPDRALTYATEAVEMAQQLVCKPANQSRAESCPGQSFTVMGRV